MSKIPLGADPRLARLKYRFDTRAAIGNNPSTKFLSDKAHYWPTESLPFAYALACTQIVILHGKADKVFNEAKEAWGLPDCQAAAEGIIINILDIKQMVRGWPVLFNNLQNWPGKSDKYTDFLILIDRLCEFIKKGFNREIDQANKVWKVLPADNPLFKAIIIWTLAEHLGIKLEEWNQYRPLVHDGKIYDTEDIMTNEPTHRVQREIRHEIISFLKKYGALTNDKTIQYTADMWYKARVEYNSAREAADYFRIDPIDLSKRIELCDDVTGWPRHK
jgi:hypothetical protein